MLNQLNSSSLLLTKKKKKKTLISSSTLCRIKHLSTRSCFALPKGLTLQQNLQIDILPLIIDYLIFMYLEHVMLLHLLFHFVYQVENHIVGAPCGVMDQMTSACGEANKLLAMVCQVRILVLQKATLLWLFYR